ncbi:uncharacterized protein GIQ15_04883 [Arthroderma uncinatum]|uniref:uncharacterized protein n=1 Tax=Arthroderma uncinatum TaxID=74035 RepID=UPI00144AF80C|nr:uncharacterized protein GIQ15_04883 [Arthroderma uncinatum]KAF3482124.1 hypothetical protein GIQ15_04883 [Arthroderma uncinatum]
MRAWKREIQPHSKVDDHHTCRLVTAGLQGANSSLRVITLSRGLRPSVNIMQCGAAPKSSAKPPTADDFADRDFSLSSPVCGAPDHWYSGGPDSEKAEKGWYFLYGKLMDLSKLAEYLDIERPRELKAQAASVDGYKLVEYGSSLELIHENDGSTARGMAVWIESSIQARNLQSYATDAFTLRSCTIILDEHDERTTVSVPGHTFVPEGKQDGPRLKPPVST